MSRGANWFVAFPVTGLTGFDTLVAPGPYVRLFHPQDLHLTLAFLGAVGEARARAAFALSGGWGSGPWRGFLGSVRPMGDPRHASALSALFETDSAVGPPATERHAAFSDLRDRMLTQARARPERREPLPHVTLARVQRRACSQEREQAIRWARGTDLGRPAVELDRLALYTWSEDRRRRAFRTVDARRLGPGA